MSRWMLVLSLAAIGVCQGVVMAGFCPTTPPDSKVEILCEDFDTYCNSGQYPGGAGVTKGTQCDPDSPLTPTPDNTHPHRVPTVSTAEDEYMRVVWPATSTALPCQFGANGSLDPCVSVDLLVPPVDLPMPQVYLDNFVMDNLDDRDPPQPPAPYDLWDYYPSSRPFGLRSHSFGLNDSGGIMTPIPQHSFKDPVSEEYNIGRFTANAFNDTKYKAVMGTDANPLVLTFMVGSHEDGKIQFSNGYIELGFGDPADHLNRANTDYVLSSNCRTVCNGLLKDSFYPVICDMYNPNNGIRLTTCPDPTLNPPPMRNAVAVGLLPMATAGEATGPCFCTLAHGAQSVHPVVFNGQWWYDFRNNTPVSGQTVRTVTDLNGTPTTLPDTLKSFVLWGNPLEGGTCTETPAIGRPYNWLTLTIKSTTATLKHVQVYTQKSTGNSYIVTDEMPNIPIAYSGPFDSIRLGIGPGCELKQDGSWDCDTGKVRAPFSPRSAQGHWAEFDDISLYGGQGWNAEGACCRNGTGLCEDGKLPSECESPDTHMGGSTWCDQLGETGGVYCCPIPYADTDGDLDVDAADFGVLQACYSGALDAVGHCNCFDRNSDGKVDATDVEKFALCATGPGIELPGECPP